MFLIRTEKWLAMGGVAGDQSSSWTEWRSSCFRFDLRLFVMRELVGDQRSS